MQPVATGLHWLQLTVTATATASATHITSASASVTTTASATPTQSPTPGETLQQWSSLIGIVTAIVGNALIALALNVQRYAHTRLHKERIANRRRARAAMKRAANNGNQTGTYGTVGSDHNGSSDINGNGSSSGASPETNGDMEHSRESDPLTASYHSGVSTDYGGDEDLDQAKSTTTYLKSPYWWLGQILITLGEMGNFLAYGFAPASIVSPLGVVALISNCIIAPVMFHERFRPRDFWGVIIAIAGVVVVVLSANNQETKLNPDDVWGAITTLAFEIYLGVTILLIIILMWASPRYGKRTILLDLGLVGLFGGYTALATKGVSSMLSSTLWRAFTTPVTYALVFVLLVTAVMQIRYVNKALQRFDSTQVIPIQFVMFTLCVILGSAILYRDFEKTTAAQAGKFVGGCLLTFFGVFLITSGRPHNHDDEDTLSETDGVEETIGLAHQEGLQHAPELRSAMASRSGSRRSSRHSRVSFADNTKPSSPTPQEDFDLPTPGQHSADGVLQAESTPLLVENWGDSEAPATPPGRGIRTLSADVVMRGSTVATPRKDGGGPGGYPPGNTLTPHGRSHTLKANHHRSGTFISPSPLSSTVTTVVKDAFLRGSGARLRPKSSMRRIRSSIRASLFFTDDEDGNPPPHASEDNLASGSGSQRFGDDGEHPDDENSGNDPARRRSRSVSDTIGDFFGINKKKTRKDTDVEQGENTDDRAGP